MSTCTLFPAHEPDPASVDPSPGNNEADPASACDAEEARPIELDGRQVDQLLLEALREPDADCGVPSSHSVTGR